MERGAVLFAVLHGVDESGILEERAVLDSLGYAHELLIHNAAGAYISVTDLAVAHLPVGKTYVHTRSADLGGGALGKNFIKTRCVCGFNCIALCFGVNAEAVHYS